MTRKDFIHLAMIQMTGNGKIFSGNMHSRQAETDAIKESAVKLADEAETIAPFDTEP